METTVKVIKDKHEENKPCTLNLKNEVGGRWRPGSLPAGQAGLGWLSCSGAFPEGDRASRGKQ